MPDFPTTRRTPAPVPPKQPKQKGPPPGLQPPGALLDRVARDLGTFASTTVTTVTTSGPQVIPPAKQPGTGAPSGLAPGSIVTKDLPFQATHPDVMAIYCSDGRFTEAVEQLVATLRRTGKAGQAVTDRAGVDTLTMPGGPGLLDSWTAHANHSSAVRESAAFLAKAHQIRHVILVAHEGCGHYKTRFPDMIPADRKERQIADLRSATEFFLQLDSQIDVGAFYATVQAGTTIVFVPVK